MSVPSSIKKALKGNSYQDFPNDLESLWMPFSANKHFKKNPRIISKAKGMYYYTPSGDQILDGVAGAVAANTVVKTSIGISGLTAILTWLVWSIFIYVIGVKIFSDKENKVPFKKVLISVGYAHAPGLLRFFAVTPDLVISIIFLTQFWIFASLIISTKQILNLKSSFKAFGIIFLSFLIIAFLSVSFVMSRMNALPISNIS